MWQPERLGSHPAWLQVISMAVGVSGDPAEPPFPICEMGITAWVLLSGTNDRMLAKVSAGPLSH